MTTAIRIVYPSSRGGEELLRENIRALRRRGFSILYDPPSLDAESWPYAAGSIRDRLSAFLAALTEKESQIILCARGGYGASDLLPLLPWEQLKSLPPKWLVGFSDVTALLSGFHACLAWPSIHGPMPASPLWPEAGGRDIDELVSLLAGREKSGSMALSSLGGGRGPGLRAPVEGWLFGGCLSVLCNLVGTPFLPPLEGALLLLEDTGENPGRILRAVNHLAQSQALQGVRGIIWGHLRELGSTMSEQAVKEEIARRFPWPMWSTADFGHLSPNAPFVIGAEAVVNHFPLELRWSFTPRGENRLS